MARDVTILRAESVEGGVASAGLHGSPEKLVVPEPAPRVAHCAWTRPSSRLSESITAADAGGSRLKPHPSPIVLDIQVGVFRRNVK